jgi:hypothetical protein
MECIDKFHDSQVITGQVPEHNEPDSYGFGPIDPLGSVFQSVSLSISTGSIDRNTGITDGPTSMGISTGEMGGPFGCREFTLASGA